MTEVVAGGCGKGESQGTVTFALHAKEVGTNSNSFVNRMATGIMEV
jgi:hypothetical protein